MQAARPGRRRARTGGCVAIVSALALTAVGPMGDSLGAAVRPPRLEYHITTLDNGLTGGLLQGHSTPIVHLQLWYHVGSKNERAGRTGFAHLFEHMMFKGSKNVDPEQHIALVAGLGGRTHAYTTEDMTVFWETAPSHALPLVLWLEADRMGALRGGRGNVLT